MTNHFDVIVIGSSFAGCHAAYPLIKAGYKVGMIDGGEFKDFNSEDFSKYNFEDLRQSTDQNKIFLGSDVDNLDIGGTTKSHSSLMTSGNKSFVSNLANKYLQVRSKDLSIIQSLARGGLGNVWGAVCDFFDEKELKKIGLPVTEINKHYQVIIDRIGISGVSNKFNLMQPASSDENGKVILNEYKNKREYFTNRNISVFRSTLALITKKFKDREATKYNDMDFWDLYGGSVYRPEFTLRELLRHKNFTYIPNVLVEKISESKNISTIIGRKLPNVNIKTRFNAKYIIVAAGAINTTKIMLRSLGLYKYKAPILIKSHTLSVFWVWKNFNKIQNPKRVSLSQVSVKSKGSYTQIYSYKSLLYYKLLSKIPLPISEALSVLSLIIPSVVIADTRFDESATDNKYMVLNKSPNGNSALRISYINSDKEDRVNKNLLRNNIKILQKLKLIFLKSFTLPIGDAGHYAGGIPMNDNESSLKLSSNMFGCVNNSKRIYVADASTWNFLPSKPPTLTIMANADRIGCYVRDLLSK